MKKDKRKMAKASLRQPKSGQGDLQPAINNLEEAVPYISRFVDNFQRLQIKHAQLQQRLNGQRTVFTHTTADLFRELSRDWEALSQFRASHCDEKTTKTPCGDICFHGGNQRVVQLKPGAVIEEVAGELEKRGIRIRVKKEVDAEAVKEAVIKDPQALAGLEHLLSVEVTSPTLSIRTKENVKLTMGDVEELRADTAIQIQDDKK
ncbi:MAG: hypothetical protein KW804_02130 [Candidatus Doudnabacteria bacterium]|nr:hypothetical protein [Candidatus Doudnabacteria bacterium]